MGRGALRLAGAARARRIAIAIAARRSPLAAISLGAVCMGALTYIGNAPNFMVYAVARRHGIAMPSFFGFMGWSVVVLGPVFVAASLLFIG